jgi:hypothetical protein
VFKVQATGASRMARQILLRVLNLVQENFAPKGWVGEADDAPAEPGGDDNGVEVGVVGDKHLKQCNHLRHWP